MKSEKDSILSELIDVYRFDISRKFTRVNYQQIDINLSYYTGGPDDAPVVIVIPDGFIPTVVSVNWFTKLTEKYKVIIPELPGFPGNLIGKKEPDTEYIVLWLEIFFELFGTENFSVINYGLGNHYYSILHERLYIKPHKIFSVKPPFKRYSSLVNFYKHFFNFQLYRLYPERKLLLKLKAKYKIKHNDARWLNILSALILSDYWKRIPFKQFYYNTKTLLSNETTIISDSTNRKIITQYLARSVNNHNVIHIDKEIGYLFNEREAYLVVDKIMDELDYSLPRIEQREYFEAVV